MFRQSDLTTEESKTDASTNVKTAPKSRRSRKPSTTEVEEPVEGQDLDDGLVIVDDTLSVDQEKVNEERRAYLEEARSQEAFD